MLTNIVWTGAMLDPSGYGEASRNYVLALDELGRFNLRLRPVYFWQGDMPHLGGMFDRLQKLERTKLDTCGPIISLQHVTPENFRYCGNVRALHIGMTTFETSGVPAAWQKHLRMMDELIVFSDFNRQVFQANGIRRPIHVVPHGVDTDRFNPNATPMEALQDLRAADYFIFGANFDWTPRKNPEAVIRAYLRSFKAADKVILVLKAYHQYPLAKSMESIRAEIGRLRQEELGHDERGPHIMVLTNILPADAMPGFYTGLDCYVLPSRGEGWGLTYSEAMACGTLTIGTNWSGNLAFMNKQNSILLDDYQLVEIKPGDTLSHYVGHCWADVDIDALGQVMKSVRENPGAYAAHRQRAVADMQQFTWRKAAQRLAEVLSSKR